MYKKESYTRQVVTEQILVFLYHHVVVLRYLSPEYHEQISNQNMLKGLSDDHRSESLINIQREFTLLLPSMPLLPEPCMAIAIVNNIHNVALCDYFLTDITTKKLPYMKIG